MKKKAVKKPSKEKPAKLTPKQERLSDLISDNRNYNQGNEKGGLLIKKSITKLGAGRSILIDKNNRIIAGNKTVENAIASGLVEMQIVETTGDKIIAVKRTDIDLDSKKGRELALADNATAKANIEWDSGLLNEDWSKEELEDWGVVTGFETNQDEYGESFELASGDKAPFQQMTFTLADEQATQIKNAITDVKETEEYKYCETFGNENSNGNALYLIISQWAEQRR